ncbi:proline dehydrogenase family protein [Rubrobacter indicoceani]|uniref:proline dehydrogenase family protein n=1 Tax=Rubrobacter indicoceani TaxID=2051957 RepID=UPI000E5BA079|nr:proline dehydrogenase family protein [Rubrobacter indicoceani]
MGLLDRAIATTVPAIPKPLVRKVSSRYIAGRNLREAVRTVRQLNAEGSAATLDVLGEGVRDVSQAEETVREYKRALDLLATENLNSGVSVKLTALGLDLDQSQCRNNIKRILEYAAARDRFVRVDMEDSPYTERTIQTVLDLHADYGNTGAVVQAYMRRSVFDVERLAERKVSVRLCKGIYVEPRRVAYKNFDVVRENYVWLLEKLFRAGCYVGVATHDEYLVWHALRLVHDLGVPGSGYEFQMLLGLGVDEPLRKILVGAGHRMRVYVPYGEQWYEYSVRRLKENPKVATYVTRDVVAEMANYLRR